MASTASADADQPVRAAIYGDKADQVKGVPKLPNHSRTLTIERNKKRAAKDIDRLEPRAAGGPPNLSGGTS